ncbi:MAG TPA: hypothetical protein VGP71_15210 [Burkholderiales bacterium]|jgi:hypothetical protein|nr:hypothetical protein [Burkholderiales bacterium]
MLRHATRLLIAIALLVAQQTAVAHQIWHLGKQDSKPAQSQLCEQHHALATVAGALDCATSDVLLHTPDAILHPIVELPEAILPLPAPVSRGPPSLL